MIEIKDNNEVLVLSTPIGVGSKRKFELMKDDYITLKFSLLNPISFKMGCYAECDFGRFEIIEDQKPSFNNSTGGYDYELKMEASYMKWKNKVFKYTPETGGNEAAWDLTAQLSYHLDIFLRNLKVWGFQYGGEDYEYEIDNDVNVDALVMHYSNTNLIDALTSLAEAANCEWWMEGKKIRFGRCEKGEAVEISLGEEAETMSLSKSSGDYFTRIYAFGSTQNISSRYRKKLEFKVDKVSGNIIKDSIRRATPDMFMDKLVTYDEWDKKMSASGSMSMYGGEDNPNHMKGEVWTNPFEPEYKDVPYSIDMTGLSGTGGNISFDFSNYTGIQFNITLKFVSGDVSDFVELYRSESQFISERNNSTYKAELEKSFRGSLQSSVPNGKIWLVLCLEAYKSPTSEQKFLIPYTVEGNIKGISEYGKVDTTLSVIEGEDHSVTINPQYYPYDNDKASDISISSPINIGEKFTLSGIVKLRVPLGYFDSDVDGLTVNGVVQRRLMLPEGTPYIDVYPDMSPDEVIEGIVTFDYIYPRKVLSISSVEEEMIDVTEGEEKKPTGMKVPVYTIKTTGLVGFDKSYVISEELTVTFKTGRLAGLTFGLTFLPEKSDDTSTCFEIVANEDYGGRLPDTVMKPSDGSDSTEADTFVMAGYDTEYVFENLVPEAEEELKAETEKCAEKIRNNIGTVSAKLMSDWSKARNETQDTPCPFGVGQKVRVNNPSFFPSPRTMRVLGYELALDIPWDSPVYTIGESASYSRLGALEDRIDSIKLNGSSYFSGKVSSSTSGTNVYLIKKDDETDPSDTNAYSSLRTDKEIKEGIEKNNNELGKKFLSKLKDDTASGIITFLRGLIIGNFSSGESGGQISDDGAAELASLLLRGALEIGKYSAGKSGAKIGEDGAAELLSVLVRGLVTAQGIQSPGFSTGALGTGLCLKMDENGDSYIEVDRMLVRKVAEFIQLVIQEIKHVGGQIVLTPASMKCIRVEDTGSAYRCYFEATDGEKTVENQFVAGDQARAQTFNVKEGVNENVKNTYYWRLVTGVGDNYIDLSKTDCDAGSTVPAAGDEIVQLGNRNDVARQAAIILSAYGNDAPYFKMYRGINSYKLEGKEFVNLSRKDVMIISDNIKLSTGETVKEYINGAVGDVQSKVDEVSGKVEDAVERLAEQQNYIAALQKIIEDLQDQIDGVIESHYGKTDPTTSNYPANEWTTEEQKQAHSNDTYTNLSTGKSWKWVKDGDTWKWNTITDTATEKALAAAAKAQDTADGKRRVFVSQPTTGQAYDVGDLWVNATYGETYKNDLLRCKTAKKENEAFSISHWELASRYTDDTKANEAAEAAREAAEAANAAQEAADEAAATAGEAKTEAQAANTELDNLKSDGTISPVEKTALKQQHADIKAEHGQITSEAGKYSISVTDYEAAYKKADAALTKYTASTPEYITVESDYSDISAYYSKRQTILDAIAAKAKEASDAAKKAADDAAAKAEEAAESASEAAQKAIEAKTAADNAAKAAKNAQTDADEANSMLSDIANDNKLTAQEKQQTKKEWDVIVSEKPKNDASADKFGVSKTAYGSAYTALSTYITPLLSDLSSTSNITGTEFRAKFKAYYDARTDLLNAISAKAKELADNAQEAADAAAENASQAIEDAATAKNAADKAQADVDAEKERMDDWAADGKFSPSEKKQLKEELARIDGDKTQVTDGYTKYGLGTPTAYNTAYTNYRTAINGVVSSSSETVAIPSDFATKRTAYYTQKSAALTAISDAAKKAADDAAAKAEEAAESASEAAQKAIEAKTAADNAAKAAKNAQTDADEANSMLSDIANDNKLTAQEKQQTKKEWDVIVSEKPKNDASADKFGVSKTAYGSAYTALSTYITPLLSDLSSTSNITGTEFRAKFKAYYDARTDLLNAISAKAKELADNAQEAADAAAENASQAIEDAATAKNAADKAQADVDAEKERMDDWAADGKFSPSEKKQLKEELARIDGDKTQVTDGYTKYGLGTPTAYNTAYTNYRTAINGVVSSSSETVAIPSDFATKRTAYYTQKSAALTAISDAAKAYADKVVAGIEVGGRNILMETNQGKKTWYAMTSDGSSLFIMTEWVDEGVKGVKIELTRLPSSWSIITRSLEGTLDLLEPNTTYMLSFDMLSNISNTLSTTIMNSNATGRLSNSPSFSFEANKKKHVVLKLVTNDLSEKGSSQVLYFGYKSVGYLCFKNLKLEKGNVATAWTPAIEDVNGMIEDAQKAADDAAEAAKNAQADATNANKELANIKSDNLISPIEKTALKQQQADIRSEYGEITANASRYAVSTTAYKSAYDLANAALTKYTASSPEYITVESDYANISAYYDARKTILDAIAAAAKKAADDATNKANQAVEDAARAGHYYLDLDNDGGPVSCDASGNVTGGFPSSKATVYYGTEPDTGWAFTGAFSGCSGSVNSSTGQITVTGVSADTGTVTVTAKKSGKTDLSAVFSVYKVKAGADGADGTNGVGIKSITNKYAVSASNTTAPTSWSDTVPTMTTTNRYLWNYEIVTYTNSTTSETKKRVIGAYGNTGNTGATGATGPKGDAAVFYTIEPSANVVKKSWDNKLTPTSVTCTKYKQTGSNARATTTEKTLKYQRVGTDSSVQTAASGSSVTVSPTSTTTSIKFWLYDGSNIIMMQEVPVVGDAVDVYTKVHAEITAAEGEIGLLSTKVTTVTDSVTGLEKEVETNTAEIKSAKGQISSTASQVSSLGTRVSTVEQTASGLTTTVNGLNGKVSKLEQTDSSLTSRITSAEGKVSTIEQKVSSISLKVDGIEPVNLFRDGSFESGYNTFRTSGSGKDDVEVGISANGKVGKNAMMVKWPGKRATVYLEQNPFVNPNATYTVSFWMYTNVATNYQAFVINALDKNDNNLSVNDSTLNIEIPGTKWTQFIHRFTTPANTERLEFYFRASTNVENGTISYIDGFMLLKGDYLDNIPSYFIPNDSVNGETLLSTGIDIENKKVIVTSDQFVIKNNDGEVTASVNEDGVLSVGSGEFSGFIRTIPRIITKNTGDNGDVEFKDNYYQISLSNLYKGGFIYVDVESNSYAGDGIKLPLGLKYAGARVTIVNKYPAKRLIITTRHEALDPGYGDWSDDENNAMRLGGVQISHVEMGNVSTQGNNRFVELLAVPYYLDETIGSVKYQGQVEWVVLNNQEFTTANNTTGVKYAKFK